MTHAIQVSGKVGDIILVLGGSNYAEFQANVADILGPAAVDDLKDLFAQALDPIAKAQGVVNQTMSTAPAPTAASSPAPAQTGPSSETDKWNNTFTYGMDDAPSCPHGQRVHKSGTSKVGKPYKAWVCPTQTPAAFRNKVQKDQDCEIQWVR